MTPDNLKELYIHQLRDLYSAEDQIIDAMPTMIEEATNEQLKSAFRTHLSESKAQKERIERVFDMMDESPKGEKCKAMAGLVKEAKSDIKDTHKLFGSSSPPEVRDAALIAQAQRIEHYEISAYGTVCTYAERLGRTQELSLLKQTLSEEKATDEKLTRLAETMINPAAASA